MKSEAKISQISLLIGESHPFIAEIRHAVLSDMKEVAKNVRHQACEKLCEFHPLGYSEVHRQIMSIDFFEVKPKPKMPFKWTETKILKIEVTSIKRNGNYAYFSIDLDGQYFVRNDLIAFRNDISGELSSSFLVRLSDNEETMVEKKPEDKFPEWPACEIEVLHIASLTTEK